MHSHDMANKIYSQDSRIDGPLKSIYLDVRLSQTTLTSRVVTIQLSLQPINAQKSHRQILGSIWCTLQKSRIVEFAISFEMAEV